MSETAGWSSFCVAGCPHLCTTSRAVCTNPVHRGRQAPTPTPTPAPASRPVIPIPPREESEPMPFDDDECRSCRRLNCLVLVEPALVCTACHRASLDEADGDRLAGNEGDVDR